MTRWLCGCRFPPLACNTFLGTRKDRQRITLVREGSVHNLSAKNYSILALEGGITVSKQTHVLNDKKSGAAPRILIRGGRGQS